ncbi:MAG: kinase-like domain-containing protein [Monoraphidium minutum]|nr:MAG: kinase-like domain-containing protein [Monoraphidium minutum]
MAMSSLQAANQVPASKVKILLSSGGTYEHASGGAASSGGGGAWRYTGGETRLVALCRGGGFSQFLAQLAKATQDVWDESCRLMYELPGSDEGGGGSATLVDLVDDDDLGNMWEEVDCATAQRASFKVRVYAQLGGKTRSSGGGSGGGALGSGGSGSYACFSADSNVVARTPQQGREAATPTKSDGGGSGSCGTLDAPTALAHRHAASRGGGGGGGAGAPASGSAGTGSTSTGSAGTGSAGTGSAGTGSAGAGSGAARGGANAGSGGAATSDGFEGFDEEDEDEGGGGGAPAARTPNTPAAAAPSGPPALVMRDLESRLEIIRPEDLRVVKLLGMGGFGEVYLSRWHSTEVAVKCLNPTLLTVDGDMGSVSRDTVAELLREANTLANLRHPNIVWVFGLVLPDATAAESAAAGGGGGEDGGGADAAVLATMMANRFEPRPGAVRPPALVTEYLGAGSLRAAIARRADFLKSDSVRIKLALDTARGMDYLHSKRIVHFDLKTANLLVGFRERSPCCKVADFGLSKQKQATYVSGVSSLRGTLPWIAPEIIRTPKEVDEKVDVYSFGIVLWELWTLREPFEGINYHALLHMMSVSREPVRPPLPGASEWEGELPGQPATSWSELMQACWSESPAARPTFSGVVARLEDMARANKIAKRRVASGP